MRDIWDHFVEHWYEGFLVAGAIVLGRIDWTGIPYRFITLILSD